MGNWRDRFEKSINQKTERKLSVYFGLYEGAWISADSTGILKNKRSKINIICFFQNQTVGVKWIYPQNSGIAKSNRDFIVRCRHEQSICRCSGRVPERRTTGSHIFYCTPQVCSTLSLKYGKQRAIAFLLSETG